jgi:hypothetical protein
MATLAFGSLLECLRRVYFLKMTWSSQYNHQILQQICPPSGTGFWLAHYHPKRRDLMECAPLRCSRTNHLFEQVFLYCWSSQQVPWPNSNQHSLWMPCNDALGSSAPAIRLRCRPSLHICHHNNDVMLSFAQPDKQHHTAAAALCSLLTVPNKRQLRPDSQYRLSWRVLRLRHLC